MSEPLPRWFYIQNGRRCGPADLFGLVDLIIKQEITEDALVWHSGLTEWVKASELPEIRRELPPPVPLALREAPLVAPVAPLEGGEIEALAQPLEPPSPSRSHERKDYRRHASEAKAAASRRRRLTLVLAVLVTLMIGLWLLLKRFNEVPAGVIIREGRAGPGPRSPAAAADAGRTGPHSPTRAGHPSPG